MGSPEEQRDELGVYRLKQADTINTEEVEDLEMAMDLQNATSEANMRLVRPHIKEPPPPMFYTELLDGQAFGYPSGRLDGTRLYRVKAENWSQARRLYLAFAEKMDVRKLADWFGPSNGYYCFRYKP